MANEENTVTKVVEGVDKLFSQIVLNGEVVSDTRPQRNIARNTSSAPVRNTAPVQGGYVGAVQLNNTLHDLKDVALTQVVATLQDNLGTAQTDIGNLQTDLSALQLNVGVINSKIPAQASSSNQLADKNFVNSSIATNTANFLGTYTALADIEAIPNPTNNDYAFLQTTDTAGNVIYKRYKYSSESQQWLFEYDLNNSSFTAEQWATINSGISGVSNTVQSGDNNPVTSDAVYQALQVALSMQTVFDTCHPIGETYTQYPQQVDPMTLYNQNGIVSTWTVVEYAGAFFRADGGNAISYDTNKKAITAVSGNTITIASHGASVGTVIFDPENDEARVVTAVSGNVLTLDSQFTSTALREVLIGQSSQNKSHNHGTWTSNTRRTSDGASITATGTQYGGLSFEGSGTGVGVSGFVGMASGQLGQSRHVAYTSSASNVYVTFNHAHDMQHIHSITADGGTEARSENLTIKVWKRTA